jgi:antiviral helicase SKI2
MYRNAVGVILKTSSASAVQTAAIATRDISGSSFGQQKISSKDSKTFWVFILTEKDRDGSKEPAVLPFGVIDIPDRQKLGYQVESIAFTSIAFVTATQIKINADEYVTIRKNSDMESLADKLYNIASDLNWNLQECDWSKIRDLDFQECYREKTELLRQLPSFHCRNCPELLYHYGLTHQERMLQEQLSALEHNLSDLNLEMLPDYHQRIDVLKQLEFIDHNSIVQIKGRVACEINTADELVLTELILDNFFTEYDATEIVALLSCFVFQEKSQQEPVLTAQLEQVIPNYLIIGS